MTAPARIRLERALAIACVCALSACSSGSPAATPTPTVAFDVLYCPAAASLETTGALVDDVLRQPAKLRPLFPRYITEFAIAKAHAPGELRETYALLAAFLRAFGEDLQRNGFVFSSLPDSMRRRATAGPVPDARAQIHAFDVAYCAPPPTPVPTSSPSLDASPSS